MTSRICPSCNNRVTPTDDWHCPLCSETIAYATEVDVCPTCQQRRIITYAKSQLRQFCGCTRSPEENSAWWEHQAELKRRDASERARRNQACEEAVLEKVRVQRLTALASQCWARHGYQCQEPYPYEFCQYCPRNSQAIRPKSITGRL